MPRFHSLRPTQYGSQPRPEHFFNPMSFSARSWLQLPLPTHQGAFTNPVAQVSLPPLFTPHSNHGPTIPHPFGLQASFSGPPPCTIPLSNPRDQPQFNSLGAIGLWHNPATTPAWPPEQALPVVVPTPYAPVNCHLPPAPNVWESGTFPPQPLGSHVPIRVHPHLIYNPLDIYEPVLQWDIVHAAELARIVSGRRILLPLPLDELAFQTDGVSKVYITSDMPYLQFWMKKWGPIIIEKEGITVRDVLDAIHAYFQTSLTREDRKAVEKVGPNKETLRLASYYRIKESYDALPGITAKQGFKRSDVLGGLRRFQGLRVVVFEDNTWKVYLGLLPGPVPNIVQ